VAVLLAASCGTPGAPGDLQVSWHFADGRRCQTTGTPLVVVEVGGTRNAFDCVQGQEPATVTIAGVPAGSQQLAIGARTSDGSTLYQGTISVDVQPDGSAAIDAPLYYTGGPTE
jgi:hypothetical protein